MKDKIIGLIVVLIMVILAAPLLVDAQEAGKVYRVGWLGRHSSRDKGKVLDVKPFLEQLHALGWVEGQNFVMQYATSTFNQFRDRAPALAVELVRRDVDVMVVLGTPGALAAKAATTTIPIVTMASLPVERGLIESLAHPGGNITGLTNNPGRGFYGKILQLFKETVPGISRVAALLNPLNLKGTRAKTDIGKDWQHAAQQLGLTPLVAVVKDASEYADAFAMFTREKADAMYVQASSPNVGNSKLITDFAFNKHRLPILTGSTRILKAGGLVYYNVSWPDLRRRSAFYVDKILRGANPADLPVERPDKFRFVINLKTAKKLGITIPPEVLYQATEVIQ